MKKFSLIFVVLMLLAFVGCGNSKNDNQNENTDSTDTVTDEESGTVDIEPTEAEPIPTDDADSIPEPSDDDADSEPTDDADSQPEPTDDDTDSEPTDDADSQPEPTDDDTDSEPTDDADSQPEPSDDDADSEPTDDADSQPELDDDDTDSEPTDDADSVIEQSDEEKCAEAGGTWNEEEHKCTKTVECSGKPANSEWSSEHTSYTMEYADGGWTGSVDAKYIDESNGYCGFSCLENYFWNGLECRTPLHLGNICTGQTLCFGDWASTLEVTNIIPCNTPAEDFFGQDAYYASIGVCTPQNLKLITSGEAAVVKDLNTGLMWARDAVYPDCSSWTAAKNYCEELEHGGYTDWRLPKPLELLTIVDRTAGLDYSLFPNITQSSDYHLWSSRLKSNDPCKPFLLNPYWGEITQGPSDPFTFTTNVICVRGNEMADPSLTIKRFGDELVAIDSSTGFMWQTDYHSFFGSGWRDALAYCENSNYAGYSDWRMPNKHELASLLNYDKPEPLFSDMPNEYYNSLNPSLFSSTTSFSDRTRAWGVSFYFGDVMSFEGKNHGIFRCVRSIAEEDANDGIVVEKTTEEKCAEVGGTWNEENEKCTQTIGCSEKPANSVWNGESNNILEYEYGAWTYPVATEHSEEEGICRFKCDTTHFWNGTSCVNPCLSFANSTGVCTHEKPEIYSCGCESGYYWWGTENGCLNRPTLGNICTGQNKCFGSTWTDTTIPSAEIPCPVSPDDDFYGQDAQYAALGHCVPLNFSVDTNISGENTVHDNNTGLEWQQTLSDTEFTWEEASNYCSGLVYGGHTDWRLPNPSELLTIVDSSRTNPSVNTEIFLNMPQTIGLWSSRQNKAEISVSHFYLLNGFVSWQEDSYTFQALCVRGTELPTASLTTKTLNGETVAIDSATKLMWKKKDDFSDSYNWFYALDYCENLSYAGFSDWRLPNKNELASLLNYDNIDRMSDLGNVGSTWSSTTYMPYQILVFRYSTVWNSLLSKNSGAQVRCVRNAD